MLEHSGPAGGTPSTATAPAAPPLRLAELRFADLYLSADPAIPPLLSHLRRAGGARGPERGSERAGHLSRLPETVGPDLAQLAARLDALADHEAEFGLVHDGVAYRCARIGAPRASRAEGGAQGWVIRQISADRWELGDLGLPDWLQAELLRLGPRGGLLLVVGPFASGKTTTASACLRDWVATHGGIGVTLEDPPERQIAGFHDAGAIYQIPIAAGQIAEAVRLSRRWAYRYALIGEVRSHEIAAETLQLALSGAMVVTTIHGLGPIEGLMAFARFAAAPDEPRGPNDRIAASVVGVLHQVLLRDRIEVRYLSFVGRNAAAMRTKIVNAQFHLLGDDLEHQTRLRELGRVAESF
ncbi:MAG: ATPase, T2SS/T4P/T4SS family [Gemmobacter sp.]